MSNESDQTTSAENSVNQASRSYVYGAGRPYHLDRGLGWLPANFWRETFKMKGISETLIPRQEEDYSDYNIKKQNAIIASSVARYNGWLVVVGFVAAIVSGLQWLEIRTGSTDTHNLAEAARIQAENSRKALIASERAWIGPVDAAITQLAANQPVNANFQYRNTGREPAPATATAQIRQYTDGEFGQFFGATQDILAEKQKCLDNVMYGGSYVFPSVGFSQSVGYVGSENSENPIKFRAAADFVEGKRVFVITGCFTYFTQSEIKHTAFCYFYKSKTTADMAHMNICDAGWYAD